jgi:L-fuconolactonase
MLIIDTHCHAGLNWFEPIETLLANMNMNGVTGAVLVQHAGTFDNTYLFECANRFPGRFKVAIQVDPEDPKPEATLEKLKRQGAAGIRLYPASKFRTAGPHDMWKRAGELGLVVTTGGSASAGEFGKDFKKILDSCPGTRVNIEHLAGAGFEPAPYPAYKDALESAKWPNTSLKVPGLGEIVRRPPRLGTSFHFDNVPPLFEMALEAFGAKRMMWGSDFPPSGGREGYRNTLEGVRNHPAFKSGDTLEWVLGKSAAALWGF